MSEFICPVVRIKYLQRHPNADTLSMIEVDGCPVIYKATDLNVDDLAVYIPVDAMVPLDNPVFKFLKPNAEPGKRYRIKAKKLRGIFSMGLLIPRKEFKIDLPLDPGIDVAGLLDIIKFEEVEDPYVPPPPKTFWERFVIKFKKFLGIKKSKNSMIWPIYDVSHYRKYKSVLEPFEPVYISEKIHGQSGAFTYHKRKLLVSSHKVLRGKEDNSNWWQVANKYDLKNKLKKYPDLVFYGEVYGSGVQDLEYDVPYGQLELAIFDIFNLNNKKWLDYPDTINICTDVGLPMVPILYNGPYDHIQVMVLSDGPSKIASHFREGVVVRPEKERTAHCGRVVLKIIGESYLLRKGGSERH